MKARLYYSEDLRIFTKELLKLSHGSRVAPRLKPTIVLFLYRVAWIEVFVSR
jgi:hypothetical protein